MKIRLIFRIELLMRYKSIFCSLALSLYRAAKTKLFSSRANKFSPCSINYLLFVVPKMSPFRFLVVPRFVPFLNIRVLIKCLNALFYGKTHLSEASKRLFSLSEGGKHILSPFVHTLSPFTPHFVPFCYTFSPLLLHT